MIQFQSSNRNIIGLLLLLFSSLFLLCTVFATDTSLANGVVTGKIHWFYLSLLFLSFTAFSVELLTGSGRKILFAFIPADGLILFFAAIVLWTYNWQLNPEPEKLFFGGQLVILWFLLRYLFSVWSPLPLLFLLIIIGTGFTEAFLGIKQLYGLATSNHSLFSLTGTFYNPGPYSGYLALTTPLCMGFIIQSGKHASESRWKVSSLLSYGAWITLFAIAIVLPAGMSRSAWLATIISCGWVYWIECSR